MKTKSEVQRVTVPIWAW